MKHILLLPLLIISLNLFSQKKNDSIPIKKVLDTVVVIQFSVKEFNALMNWIDNLPVSHQEVKTVQKLIYDRVKLVKK